MKAKILLAAIVFVFSTVALHAQQNDHRTSFAITVQPHVNWMHVEESTVSNGPVRLGIAGGLRIDYQLEKFYALSFGLNFNQTGGNIIYNESIILDRSNGLDTLEPGTRITYHLQYVEIPLALKFLIPEIGYTTGFAEIGIDPMINTRASIDATDNNIVKEPFKNGVGRVNLGWHTGLGINYSLGAHVSLQFALVYKNTFLDVTRENDIRKRDHARVNQIGINFGIVF